MHTSYVQLRICRGLEQVPSQTRDRVGSQHPVSREYWKYETLRCFRKFSESLRFLYWKAVAWPDREPLFLAALSRPGCAAAPSEVEHSVLHRFAERRSKPRCALFPPCQQRLAACL